MSRKNLNRKTIYPNESFNEYKQRLNQIVFFEKLEKQQVIDEKTYSLMSDKIEKLINDLEKVLSEQVLKK